MTGIKVGSASILAYCPAPALVIISFTEQKLLNLMWFYLFFFVYVCLANDTE